MIHDPGGDVVSFATVLILLAAGMSCSPLQTSASIDNAASGLSMTGAAAEEFLRTAEVITLEHYDTKGITRPRKATLSDGERTVHAVFKDVDKLHTKVKLTTGKTLFKLLDSYRHEIAAYELDKLLGLGLVPPCVERRIRGTSGSLCLWVEGAMTEWQRANEKKIQPPNVIAYNNQMHDIKLLMQLDWDADYNNTSNLIIDGNWKLYKVDSSRAFRADPKLRRAATLSRFRRSTVEALRCLGRDELDSAMTPWISPKAVDALWKRRGSILEIVDDRIADHGEAAVLYD
jgi:hypothetical protein